MVIQTGPTFAQSLGFLLARIGLGATFFAAGLNKFLMEGGVRGFVTKVTPTASQYMPENLANLYVNALPYAEIAIGALLVLGLLTRVIALLTATLLVSFIIAATGIVIPPAAVHANVAYLSLALLLVLCGPGRMSLDAVLWGRRRAVAVVEEQRPAAGTP